MAFKSTIKDSLISGNSAQVALAYATYLGLAATVWPSISGIVDGLRQKSSLSAVAWSMYLAAVIFLLLRVILKKKVKLLPQSRVFQPFTDIKQLRLWPREREIEQIRRALGTSSHASVAVVVGPSGAGKTVILRRLLPEALGLDNSHYQYVDQYLDFDQAVKAHLRTLDQADPGQAQLKILALDQFEQMLARIAGLPSEQRASEWRLINEAIDSAWANNIHVIVSIRYEWYFDLKGLHGKAPRPDDAIYIGGPTARDRQDETLAAITSQLRNALGNDSSLADAIISELGNRGNLLLLETQIVGSALESLHRQGDAIDASYLQVKLGGVNGAIDLYFDQVLSGAPDRRIALKVLAALSTTTRFRRQENLTNVHDVLFENSEEITAAITYLEQRGLVMDRGNWGQLELTHDFVAEYFNSRCGYELRPTDRDNVVFHLEAWPSLGPVVLDRRKRGLSKGRLGWAVFIALFTLMTARLFGFGLDWIRVGKLQPQYSTNGWLFDITYVPIFLAHGAWVIYIILFYTRVLSMLDERPLPKLMSQAVPVFMASCVAVAAFIPYAWLFSIGCGGMFLALKLLTLGQNRDLSAGARARMSEFGRTTLAALGVITAVGFGGMWASFAFDTAPDFQQTWTAVTVFAGLGMTLPAMALAPYHVHRPAVAEFLGLLARSPRGVVPRSAI